MTLSLPSRKMLIMLRIWTAAFLVFVLTLSPVLPSIAPIILFGALSSSASTITWTGLGETGYWNDAANWSEDRVPTENDIVVIGTLNGPVTEEQSDSDVANGSIIEIDEDTIVTGIEITKEFRGLIRTLPKRRLTVGREGFSQAGGRFIGSNAPMDVRGSVSLLGGEFNAPAGTLEIAGNLRVAGGTFNHNAGTVAFDGFEQIIAGSINFHNFTKITQLAQTLELPSGSTIKIENSLKLKGAAPTPGGGPDENLLTIQSSKVESPVLIDPRGAIDVAYVHFDNSINTSTKTITCQEYCELSGATGGIEVPGGEAAADGPLVGADPRVQGLIDEIVPDLIPQDNVPPENSSAPGNSSDVSGTDSSDVKEGTVARLIVKKTEAASENEFDRGDIVSALNTKRILTIHAQNITNPKYQPFNKFGLREPGGLLDIYLQNAKEFKFERIGPKEVKRTDLETGQEDVISDTPNAAGEHMDVSRYISRRLQNPNHQIFGEPGAEYWYGGSENASLEKLDIIWQAIEEKTEHRRENLEPPITPAEKRKYELIAVEDFSDEEAGELTSLLRESESTEAIPDSTLPAGETEIASPAARNDESIEAPRRFKVDLDALANRQPGQKLKLADIIQDKTKPLSPSLKEVTEGNDEAIPETESSSPSISPNPSPSLQETEEENNETISTDKIPSPSPNPSPVNSSEVTGTDSSEVVAGTPTPSSPGSPQPSAEAATPSQSIEPSPSPSPLTFLKSLLPKAVHAATKAITWLVGSSAHAANSPMNSSDVSRMDSSDVVMGYITKAFTWLVGSSAHAATVTTSIGTRSAENVDITAVSGTGPYTVTLNVATSNTANGDTLTDEAVTPNSYLITAGAGTTSLTVRDAFGAGTAPSDAASSQATTTRTNSTIQGWEDDLDDTGIYAASDDAVGEIYNDAALSESVTIDGGGTVGLNSRTLTVPESERHDGTAGTGARNVGSGAFITLNLGTTLEWFEMDGQDGGSGHAIRSFTGTSVIRNMIVHDYTRATNSQDGIVADDPTTITNTIIYNIQSDHTGEGTRAVGIYNRDTTSAYNVTIHNTINNNGTGTFSRGTLDVTTLTNSLVTDTGGTAGNAIDIVATTQSHNASTDTSASGTGSLTEITTANQYVSTTGGSEDLHLKSGSDAIGAGTDLAQTPSGVEFDIDGRDRHTENDTWDIGADQSAVEFIWDGGGADNNWTTPGNWSDNVVPGSSDLAVFDSTSTKDATIDTSISVAGIDINSGYTGTITQGTGNTITLGNSGYNQADGTFAGGNSTITLGTGASTSGFTLTGGTFTSTSGTLQNLYDSNGDTSFTVSGGTFNHNSGTIVLNPSLWTTNTSINGIVLNNFEINAPGNSGRTVNFSGATVEINGTLTLTDGQQGGGTFEADGTISVGANWDGGSGVLNINEASDQSFTVADGGALQGISLNSTSTTIDFAGANTTIGGPITLTSGTFTAPSGTLTHTYDVNGGTGFTYTSGTFNHNSGTFKIQNSLWPLSIVPGSATFNNVELALPVATQRLLTISGSTWDIDGSLTLTSGRVNGAMDVAGSVVVGSSYGGGTATLAFTGTNNQTYTDNGGDEPDGDITINKTSGTVTLASNADWNATSQDVTITDGALDLDSFTLSTNTFTSSDTLTLQGPSNLSASSKTFNSGSTTTFTGDGDAAEDTYTISDLATSYGNLTINPTDTQDIFQATSALTIANTLTHSAGTLILRGDDTVNAASIGSSTTVQYTGDGDGSPDSFAITDIATTYGNLDINSTDVSDSFTLGSTTTLNGTLDVTSGALTHGSTSSLTTGGATTIGANGVWFNIGSGDITLGGNITNSGYVHIDGNSVGCGDTDDIAITGTATWSNSGTLRIYDVDASNQADSSITAYSSTDTAGNTWTFNGTCPTNEFFWDGGGGDNNWATGDNWDVGTAPTSADVAIFGPYSTKDATIAASINVLGVEINQGYTGTITQAASQTVTTGTSGWNQAAGTFTGGDSAITIKCFNQSGGIFTATSSTTTINGTDQECGTTMFVISGGTFNHNSGTFVAAQGHPNGTYDINTSLTLNNVTINNSDTKSSNIPSGDTIIVNGTLTLTDGRVAGPGQINAKSTISVGSAFDGGQSEYQELLIDGISDQSFTIADGGIVPGFELNQASTTINFAGTNATINGRITLTSGTFTAPTGTLTLNVNRNFGNCLTITGGTFNHSNGTINATYGHPGCTWDVNSSLTVNNLTINSGGANKEFAISSGDTVATTGTFTLTDGSLATGTLSAQGDVTIGAGADGGTALLQFTGTNNQTYTDNGGVEPAGDITINKSSGKVTLATATDWDGTNQDLTITDGILDLAGNDFTLSSSGTFTNNDTLMLDGDEVLTNFTNDTDSGRVVYNGTGSYTGLAAGDAYNDLTINNGLVGYWKMDEGADNTCAGGEDVCDSSGNENHGTGTNWDSDEWVGSTGPTLNFTNPDHLDFDASDDYVTGSASFDLGNYTLSAWIYPESVTGFHRIFTDNNNTSVLLNADKLAQIVNNNTEYTTTSTTAVSTGSWYHIAVVKNLSGSTTYFYINGVQDTTTVSSTVDPTATSTFYIGSSATPAQYWDGKIDDVRLYDTALTATQVSALYTGGQALQGTGSQTLDANLDVNGDLTLNSGTLDVSGTNYSINVEGSWENNGGTFEAQAGTVEFDGTTGSHELQTGGQNFYDLDFATSGGTWTLHDRLEADNTLTQSNATLDTSSNNYNLVVGDFDQTAGTFTANSSTLTLNSSSNQTVNFNDPVYDVQVEDPTENGLVGYWKFDEGQGTSAYDSSGNGNTGTLTNSPKWSEDVNSTTTYDNPYSLDFDGTDDYVDIPDDIWNTDIVGSQAFTVSGWAKLDGTASEDVIAGINGSSGMMLWHNDNAGWELYIGGARTSDDTYASSTAGVWTHVLGVSNGSSTTLYINGSQEAHVDTTPTIEDESPSGLAIGADSDSGASSRDFAGLIDDVRIYNRALDSAEISRLAAGKYADGDSSTATFTLNTALDVNNDLTLQSGILSAGANNITLANDWNNYAGDSALTAGTGTVTLDGTDQAVNGSTSFYNLSKTESNNDATDETITFESGYDPSLIGYWKMDEGADNTCSGGEDVCDTTSNGNHGTIQNGDADEWVTGAPTLNYTNSFAMDFDGSDDYVSLPGPTGLTTRTYSAWVKSTDAPSTYEYVLSDGTGWQGLLYRGGVSHNTWIYYNSAGSDLINYGTTYPSGWTHVAFVDNGTSTALYLNGASVDTGSSLAQAAAPRIGFGGAVSSPWHGQIDDVRIYNRALSANEVARLANGDQTAINTTTVANTLTLDGRDADDRINIVSSTSGVQHTFDVTSGDQTVDFLDVADSATDSNDIICQSCVDGSNNDDATATPHWIFQAAANIVIQGIVYADKAVTALTGGKTVSVAVNGTDVASTETNATTGEYSLDSIPASATDIITVYLEDETEDAVTVTESNGSDMTGVDLYQDYLITRHDNSDALTNTDLSTGAVGGEDDVSNIYSITTGNLTTASGKSLYVPASHTYTPGGNVTVSGAGGFGMDGTFNQGTSNTVTVGTGGYTQNSGTFNGGDSSITMNRNFTLTSGAFTSTSGTFTQVVSQTTGTTFTVSGGTFNHNNGTTVLSVRSHTIDVPTSITFYNLTQTGDGAGTLNIASGDTLITEGTLNLAYGSTNNGSIEAKADATSGSSYSAGSTPVTLKLTGSSPQTYTVTGGGIPNLEMITNADASVVFSAGINATLGGNLTMSTGTFTSTSGTLSVSSSTSNPTLTISGGTFNHNNGTVNFGGRIISLDVPASGLTFNNLGKLAGDGGNALNIASGDTITAEGTFTFSSGTVNTGTIAAQGNVVINSGAGGGSALLQFTGTNNQVYTDNGGNEPDGDITINKTLGTVTLASNADWNASGQDLTITDGELVDAGYTISLAGNWSNSDTYTATGTVDLVGTNQTVTGDTTFYNLNKTEGSDNSTDETITFGAGDTFGVSGFLGLQGRDSDDRINILSDSAGTRFTLDVTSGQQVEYWLDVKDSQASSYNIACQNCINSGGNDDGEAVPHWIFGNNNRGRLRIIQVD